MKVRRYDSTVARIAGNIVSGSQVANGIGNEGLHEDYVRQIARDAVRLARAIVAESERTEPAE